MQIFPNESGIFVLCLVIRTTHDVYVYSLLLVHSVVEESECKNEYLTNKHSFFIIICTELYCTFFWVSYFLKQILIACTLSKYCKFFKGNYPKNFTLHIFRSNLLQKSHIATFLEMKKWRTKWYAVHRELLPSGTTKH